MKKMNVELRPAQLPKSKYSNSWFMRHPEGVAVCSALVVMFWLAIPHLSHWPWHDEIYTLESFATGNLTDALLDYHLPNNHILFSAIFGQIRKIIGLNTLNVFQMRIIMFAFSAAGISLMYLAVRKLSGTVAATLCLFMLATSHVILSFCTEIRGYSFSWIFTALGLYSIIGISNASPKHGSKYWFIYSASAFASVGILPTNLLVFFILASWYAILTINKHGLVVFKEKSELWKFFLLLLLPFSGLLFLLPVYADLAKSMNAGSSEDWSILLSEWPWAVLRDFWWLLPLSIAGMFFRKTSKMTLLYCFILLLSLVVPLLAVLPLYGHVPNSRVLSTVVPLVYAAMASGVAQLCSCHSFMVKNRVVFVGCILLVLVAGGYFHENNEGGYYDRYTTNDDVYNLYDHTPQHGYKIVEAVQKLQSLSKEYPSVIIVGDCDPMAVFWYSAQIGSAGTTRMAPMAWEGIFPEQPETKKRFKQYAATRRILVMLRNEDTLSYTASAMGELDSSQTRLLAQYGYFKIYEVFLKHHLPKQINK